MLNYLWGFILVIGIGYGAFTGRIGEVNGAIVDSGKEAVTLCITMLGIMSFWTGLMQIAKKAGILDVLIKIMRPLLKLLFPDIPQGHPAYEYISSNMIANVLGLGWVATPMGLKAMQALQELNEEPDYASIDMCTFLIVNISSLQLIPVNIIAYRSQYGSVKPTEILAAAILSTAVSTLAGVLFSVVARKRAQRKGRGSQAQENLEMRWGKK